jgi:hypothetical protein
MNSIQGCGVVFCRFALVWDALQRALKQRQIATMKQRQIAKFVNHGRLAVWMSVWLKSLPLNSSGSLRILASA